MAEVGGGGGIWGVLKMSRAIEITYKADNIGNKKSQPYVSIMFLFFPVQIKIHLVQKIEIVRVK